MNSTRFWLVMLSAFLSAATLSAQSDWDDPFPPHRIADHLYYVGSKGLATYLITTTNGHVLINTSFERTVPIIRANVEQLGFNRLLKNPTSKPFVDPEGYRAYVEDRAKAFREAAQKQRP